jgi:glycosyltransferase involved in cell wall biosynthesis
MRISVVTIAYNRARLLGEAVASVLAQTHGDLEHLVVDDGSTDDTEAVVRAFRDPRVRYVRLPHSGGRLSRLRARALELAAHDWIAFLDSDDLWLPRKLEAQAARVGETGVEICAGGVTVFGDGARERVPYGAALDGEAVDLFDLNVRRNVVLLYVSALLFRRDLVAAVGGFDESLRCGEHDLFTRMIAAFPSTVVKEPLVRIRRHPGNGTNAALGGVNAYDEHLVTLRRLLADGRIDGALHARLAAHDHYRAGSLLLASGRVAAARPHLLGALRARPRRQAAKAAVKLAASFVAPQLLARSDR